VNPRLYDTYDAAEREHYRRRNLMGHGTLTMVDDTGKVQVHQYLGYPTELRFAAHYGAHGLASVPLPGSTMVTLHQGGYRGNNLAVALVDARYRPTGHKPGEVAVWMVDGAGNDGAGGTMWKILEGLIGAVCKLFGKTMVIGDATNTTTIDVYGKTSVTIHSPSIVATNGGTPHNVLTNGGTGVSPVLKADS
jgi:phage gp45-like